jgi:hypothetical protein
MYPRCPVARRGESFPGQARRCGSPRNGGVAVIVTNVRFTIRPPVRAIAVGWWRVDPGASLDLFREVYGEYELTIDQQGVRSSGGLATVVMTIRDDNGASATITPNDPIVAGSLPTTDTGATSGPFTIC